MATSIPIWKHIWDYIIASWEEALLPSVICWYFYFGGLFSQGQAESVLVFLSCHELQGQRHNQALYKVERCCANASHIRLLTQHLTAPLKSLIKSPGRILHCHKLPLFSRNHLPLLASRTMGTSPNGFQAEKTDLEGPIMSALSPCQLHPSPSSWLSLLHHSQTEGRRERADSWVCSLLPQCDIMKLNPERMVPKIVLQ